MNRKRDAVVGRAALGVAVMGTLVAAGGLLMVGGMVSLARQPAAGQIPLATSGVLAGLALLGSGLFLLRVQLDRAARARHADLLDAIVAHTIAFARGKAGARGR